MNSAVSDVLRLQNIRKEKLSVLAILPSDEWGESKARLGGWERKENVQDKEEVGKRAAHEHTRSTEQCTVPTV